MISTAQASSQDSDNQMLIEAFAHADDHAYSLKFKKPLRRQQSLLGRALTRAMLARRSPANSQDWNLNPVDGYPWQARHSDHLDPVFFSISHSQHWVVAAISTAHPVGIDIETIDHDRDMQRLLNGIVAANVSHLPTSAAGKYLLWSAFEAYCKARHQRLVFPIPAELLSIDWDQPIAKDSILRIDQLNFTINAHLFDRCSWALCQQNNFATPDH